LVVGHIFHEKIKEEVEKYDPLPPKQRITRWAIELTNVINGLSEDELKKYALVAEKWKAEGPPEEIKRR
jgi:hypothetical protein